MYAICFHSTQTPKSADRLAHVYTQPEAWRTLGPLKVPTAMVQAKTTYWVAIAPV
jgi:hypothetical protein